MEQSKMKIEVNKLEKKLGMKDREIEKKTIDG